MEKTLTSLQELVQWISQTPAVPLVFAETDLHDVLQTDPQPLLEFVLVRSGGFRLEVARREAELVSGDVAWINAHHGNRADLARTGARYACLSLDVGGRPEFRRLARVPLLTVLRGPSLEWTVQAFAETVRWHRAVGDPLREPMLRAALVRLLGSLSADEGTPGAKLRPASFAKALELLEQSSSEPELSIATIARRAGVSSSTLRRLFRQHLKCTPIDYLQNLRLSRARDLLVRSPLAIKEVAMRVGYVDALYFSKTFRQRFGVPPTRWQRSRGEPIA